MSYMVNNPHRLYGSNDGCNYAQLNSYTASFRGIRPPMAASTVTGYYVVPDYSSPGYNTLMKTPPGSCASSGGGYTQIPYAYGVGANNCVTSYSASIC